MYVRKEGKKNGEIVVEEIPVSDMKWEGVSENDGED